ncbi:mannitol-1-phosphate 5-dehydrogenase [Paenibacillus camelliae]|uniref:mannitol-1-phosphate 5-dehydrogenase n=1 Tax=Paenibacillus camelliae TaxID=512410 RepID=UPI00203AC114|nr:mannitol-1-phosphate 5-dehydrogenase [Paenibacillus camelliae]MCM3634019.1 mannitol-1-phosphate 5-dehydrogenase [Paenibacillus camelliae]
MIALHFGAGNIGRGFIGLLLSQSGYEVVFSDVNQDIVQELQKRGQYTVTLANETHDQLQVTGVTAIDGTDLEKVAETVAKADLVTTAVGVNILKHIAKGIAVGIERRVAQGAAPLHVIACENAIGGSTQLKEHVFSHLPEEVKAKAEQVVAFPDAAVDRIVPIQHHEDRLAVTVEPFHEWVIDESAMFDGYKVIDGVHYVTNLQPYIERKLFTVNTGHATAAYIGNLHRYETIQQAMADEQVVSEVKATLAESGGALIAHYQFDQAEHQQYIDTIIERFRNTELTDEISRVGRSPIRKLSPNDRLVRPAMLALEVGIEPKHLANAMAAALRFDVADDPESVELQQLLKAIGINETLTKVTSLSKDHPIHRMVVASYEASSAK